MKLDARDKHNTWFESVVKDVTDTAVDVHFCGWADKFDESIPRDPKNERLAPLNTYVCVLNPCRYLVRLPIRRAHCGSGEEVA